MTAPLSPIIRRSVTSIARGMEAHSWIVQLACGHECSVRCRAMPKKQAYACRSCAALSRRVDGLTAIRAALAAVRAWAHDAERAATEAENNGYASAQSDVLAIIDTLRTVQ